MSAAPDVTRGVPAISVVGVSRRFGTVQALDDVSLEVARGEVHALLGENGAGKTTLVRILAGLDRADTGQLVLGGVPYAPRSPREGVARGVTFVQQHFALVPTMTAAENLLLFRSDRTRRLRRAQVAKELEALAAEIGFAVDPNARVESLSVGERQRLELLRALDAEPDVLLLDEPTAVLTDVEATAFLGVVRRLVADRYCTVVFITHRLREVVAGADRVTVLRNGRVVSAGSPVGERTAESLAAEMVGDEVSTMARVRAEPGAVLLDLAGITAAGIGPIDMQVREREVLGVAGVDGNGQAELEALLTGGSTPDAGTLEMVGKSAVHQHPRARIRASVAYIPSDRYMQGLVGPMRCDENLLLGRTSARVRIRPGPAQARMDAWQVRGVAAGQAGNLSGGNAQKLVAARELGDAPRLVLAFQPTRGLDPGAAAALHDHLLERAAAGSGILWVSADLDELLEVADRIVVLLGGKIAGEFRPPFQRRAIGLAMGGAHP